MAKNVLHFCMLKNRQKFALLTYFIILHLFFCRPQKNLINKVCHFIQLASDSKGYILLVFFYCIAMTC